MDIEWRNVCGDNEKRLSLKELYDVAPRVEGKNRNILRLIRTELAPGIPVMIVFVRHRSKKNEWLALLSTDLTLTAQEIIRIYRMRARLAVCSICCATKSAHSTGSSHCNSCSI
ncbi:hypothetical protein ACF3MZ_10815 [Paenibacillaceae bacterium WGS1546]|uniref:hypothetical protein n=1 Tax=Cohnella sp. WGS1546 TaxID=3366810 RepID=UPI00372D3924